MKSGGRNAGFRSSSPADDGEGMSLCYMPNAVIRPLIALSKFWIHAR